jgi:hypothetical protein
MGTAGVDALVVAALFCGPAFVAGATRLEGAAVPHLTALAGRPAERAATLRPFATVEGRAAAWAPPFTLAPLVPTVFSARHGPSAVSDTRCDGEGPLRQRCGSST